MFKCIDKNCPNFDEIFNWEDPDVTTAQCGGCGAELTREK